MLPEPMFEHLRLGRADFLKGRLPDTLEQDCFVQSHMLQIGNKLQPAIFFSIAYWGSAQHSWQGSIAGDAGAKANARQSQEFAW